LYWTKGFRYKKLFILTLCIGQSKKDEDSCEWILKVDIGDCKYRKGGPVQPGVSEEDIIRIAKTAVQVSQVNSARAISLLLALLVPGFVTDRVLAETLSLPPSSHPLEFGVKHGGGYTTLQVISQEARDEGRNKSDVRSGNVQSRNHSWLY